MPYTALQTLGWLARCSKWERAFNVNRSFLRYSAIHQQRNCELVVGRKKGRGRKRSRRGLVVVFKTTAQKAAVKMEKGEYGGRGELSKRAQETKALTKGHQGCGMLDCRVCEALFGMWCGELEAVSKNDHQRGVGRASLPETNPEEEEHAGNDVAGGCAVFNARDC